MDIFDNLEKKIGQIFFKQTGKEKDASETYDFITYILIKAWNFHIGIYISQLSWIYPTDYNMNATIVASYFVIFLALIIRTVAI